MTGLVAWLRAALDEHERIARAATPGPWTTPGPDTVGQWLIYDPEWVVAEVRAYTHNEPYSDKQGARGPGYIDPDANAAHIARNNPADALRTVAAHRAILDAHPLTVYTDEEPGYVQILNDHVCPGTETPCQTVRALVSIYRDSHPGFNPAWIGDH